MCCKQASRTYLQSPRPGNGQAVANARPELFHVRDDARVEPTNNLAERAIRFVVIDRQITQGTRSKAGQRWCERIWTVIATCTQQGRSVFDFLYAAVKAYFGDGCVPSLLTEG